MRELQMKLSTTLQAILLFTLSSRTCYAQQHGFLTNVFSRNNNGKSTSIMTKDCKGAECSIDTSTFDIVKDNDMDTVSFDLHGSGRSITCTHVSGGIKANQWVGKCEGGGFANLVQRGTNAKGEALVYGSVADFDADEICTFSPKNGNNAVTCIPADDFGEAEEAPDQDDEDEGLDGGIDLLLDTKPDILVPDALNSSFRGSNAPNDNRDNRRQRQQTFDDSGGNIDAMFVWTTSAECRASGLEPPCTLTEQTEEVIRGRIEAGVAETNMVFANSGINTVLRLVHAYRTTSYAEQSGGDPFMHALNSVTKNDEVHGRRLEYGADAVILVPGFSPSVRGGVCGRGWRPEPVRRLRMFSVVDQQCGLFGNFILAHELGHNFGVRHDRPSYNLCANPGHAYGYRDSESRFRTVLATNCRRAYNVCGNIPRQTCPRIPYFSSSTVQYDGLATGNAQNDAAKTINDLLPTVASFYTAVVQEPAQPAEPEWEEITYDDFESGYGSFMIFPGSDDATRITGSQYVTGSAGIRLRDNRNKYSGVYHQVFHDVSSYSRLRVEFSYCAESMEGGEGFFVDVLQSGSTWTSVAQYVRGEDFENGVGDCPRRETAEIDASALTNIKIRFRCDASNDQDWVYIDDVTFEGQVYPTMSPVVSPSVPALPESTPEPTSSLVSSPIAMMTPTADDMTPTTSEAQPPPSPTSTDTPPEPTQPSLADFEFTSNGYRVATTSACLAVATATWFVLLAISIL